MGYSYSHCLVIASEVLFLDKNIKVNMDKGSATTVFCHTTLRRKILDICHDGNEKRVFLYGMPGER